MCRVEQHLVPDGEAHVPAVRVELRLAPVLPLLQQCPHLARYLRQQVGRRRSVASRGGSVWRRGQEQWAARVLAAVGVEGRVAGAERRRRVVDRKLDQRHELGPVVAALAGEGAQHVGDDAVDALRLGVGVVVVRRAEDELGAQLELGCVMR